MTSNQDSIATHALQRRVADLEVEAERLRLLAELQGWYITFLNKANEGPITLAAIHGWQCPPEHIAMGEDYRRRIAELQAGGQGVRSNEAR